MCVLSKRSRIGFPGRFSRETGMAKRPGFPEKRENQYGSFYLIRTSKGRFSPKEEVLSILNSTHSSLLETPARQLLLREDVPQEPQEDPVVVSRQQRLATGHHS
jgi:hypothetical protein